MDVLQDAFIGQNLVQDDVALTCQYMFTDFLYQENSKFLPECIEISSNIDRCTLTVNFNDIQIFSNPLATTIKEEYYRVYPYLCQSVTNYVRDNTKTNKDCYLSLIGVSARLNIRELKTNKMGTLIRIFAHVVRAGEVMPELVFGTFECMECGTEIRNVEQEFKYTNPKRCKNPVCTNRSKFKLNTEKSTFVDFQKVVVQETQTDLPRGLIPRPLDVILRAETVDTILPGAVYDFTGTLIVVPDVGCIQLPGAKVDERSRHKPGDGHGGVRGMKCLGVRDLNYRLAFIACSVCPEFLSTESTQQDKLLDMSKDPNIYLNLADSLFPSIYRNDEIKRGVLLQILGGVPKITKEKTTLRGDINVCIVGDPSTAKSQFLIQLENLVRNVKYVSGKSSTAAGLTAAVVRYNFAFVIEVGALVLADNGICCIDEFDQMLPRDQVAIHEVMEQQTVSIAKAGIRATLNARTSILAAASPNNGRYDPTKSLSQNINVSPPLMSRFDLFFVLIDECDETIDYAIARRILDLHRNALQCDQVYEQQEVKDYIAFAQQFKPKLTFITEKLLVEKYKDLRINYAKKQLITVRQLEGMIRLSEAMAKLECSSEVLPNHVNAVYELFTKTFLYGSFT